MKYAFPTITHIDQVLAAVKGRDEFKVANKGDYLVVNYFVNFADTFPEVKGENALLMALRRECRGIIFCANTGKILRRPLHKFFNLGERDETQVNKLDFNQSHLVMTKRDGSMIAPFITENRIRFGTKMGVTDVSGPVEDFVQTNTKFLNLAEHCIKKGLTPIFEWTGPAQRIVIAYPENTLTLIAIRHMVTGEYLSY